MRKASRIICVSDTLRQILVKKGIVSHHRTAVIWHGVDRLMFTPPTSRNDQEPLPAPRAHVLYVSDVDGHKNHAMLIRAYAALSEEIRKEHPLLIVGRLVHPYADDIGRLIQDLNIRRDVVLTGALPHAALPDVYRKAAVFVFPSLSESFGMPLVEAMASGTPIVASNAGAIPEILGEAGLLFDPADPEELGRLLDKLLTDTPLREELAWKGIQRAQCFDWDRTGREVFAELQNVYRERQVSADREAG